MLNKWLPYPLAAGLALTLFGCLAGESTEPAVNSSPAARSASAGEWQYLYMGDGQIGTANDLSGTPEGAVLWVTRFGAGGGNNDVYRMYLGNGYYFAQGAVKLCAAGLNQFMAIKADGSLWQVINDNWSTMGSAVDVDCKSQTYRLNPETNAYGHTISKRSGSSWVTVPGAGHRIAVAPNGDVWVINNLLYNQIYRLPAGSSTWQTMPGSAREITVTYDGTVYCISTEAVGSAYRIKRYNPANNSWTSLNSAATRIAGGPGKWVYVTNEYNMIRYANDPQ